MLPKNRKKHSSLLTFFSGPQSYSWCCFTAYVKVFPFKKLRSSLTVRWTWMAGKTAEPLTTCSRLSTVHQANSASKNKQLNFCWNKNGRVWNSSLPSDTGSLIFINGSWNSPRLPLHCGKNVAWSRQCHLQVSRRTRLIGLLTTLQHKIHSTRMPVWALLPSGNIPAAPSNCTFREIHREFLEEDSTVWCHVGKLQPEDVWLTYLGSQGSKGKFWDNEKIKLAKCVGTKMHCEGGVCPHEQPSQGATQLLVLHLLVMLSTSLKLSTSCKVKVSQRWSQERRYALW